MIIRIFSIIYKELLHIRRDPRSLGIMIVMPVVMMFLLGYIARTDVKHLPTALLDRDHTPQSRELAEAYQVSRYFDITRYVTNEAEMLSLLDRGEIEAGISIPAGYGERLTAGSPAQVSFLIDGSDPNISLTAYSAAQTVGQAKSVEVVLASLKVKADALPGIDVRTRVLYNPDMKSAVFMVPSLMGLILQFGTTMFTALAIVREREEGTIEQIIVTPVRPWELIVGKIVPYVAIASWNVMEVLLVSVFWFKVPVRGSIPLLLGLSPLFLLTSLGVGLLISSLAKTQQEAMFLSFFWMLPTIFLSGFFFPIQSMPSALRTLSYVVPLRYFLIIVRRIMLKGVGVESLTWEITALCVFGVAILFLAIRRFHKRLE